MLVLLLLESKVLYSQVLQFRGSGVVIKVGLTDVPGYVTLIRVR